LKGPGTMACIAELVARAAGQEGGGRRLLAATTECAERCAVQPGRDLGWASVCFPEPQLVGASAATAADMLRSRCAAAMAERGYDRDPAMTRRLAEELQVIEKLGYPTYFLTVAQVVDDTRELGVRVAARGSAAGCLVTHLLGVTAANPVQHGLLMERFLSLRRTALPDIDIDVESARRPEVYQAIFDRFGADRVATVSMHVTYRVRHAIRDAGAALGLPPTQIDKLAKAFPQHLRACDTREALRGLPELAAVAARATEYGRLWDLVERLDELPTGIAMHPCGVLLSDARLRDRTPVVPSGMGWPMSQFDTGDVERMGLLKLDVLGVRMQSAMVHAVAEVERTTGQRIDLDDPAQIPPEDPDTYQLIRSAQTLGCFQIESPGQRDLLGRLQPKTFHDLVTDISLFRPGPVAADMVTPFIAARHGHRRPHYAHPDLTPALQETYGVLVWHEQVIRLLSFMTGCDHAEADEARRALSEPQAQERVRRWFAAQARGRGYNSAVIEETWASLAAFGAYGFCKAHAVAFAVPTYQSAWLKAHHPAAFYAGVLTHDAGMYPRRVILADARRRGIAILPLDINRSGATYRIEPIDARNAGSGYGLRMALSQVYGITAAETTRIIAGQPYTSLSDLWQRARPTRPVAERLAQTGALETITPGQTRRDVLTQIAQLHQRSAATTPLPASGLPEMTGTQKLRAELAVLGMDISRHLMDHYRDLLAELGAIPAHQLAHIEHGTTVLVAGVKAAIQTPPTRSRHRVIFLTLDDADGLIDLAFLGNTHPDSAHTLFHSELLLVQGTLHHRGPLSHTVIGARAWNLAELAATHRQGQAPMPSTTS
ncbi:MAG TPA: DNA polymerase III subunit alpha, partial [Actinoallomurus sp.]|nr:DNA polymerase III subunit alpha [Actinoallomurus sp.]